MLKKANESPERSITPSIEEKWTFLHGLIRLSTSTPI
jgi:hypothetical protein